MLPILIPIVSMLADKGMNLISKALDSGEQKAVEFIEEKTGIKVSEPEVVKNLSTDDIEILKTAEKDYELELMRFALMNKQEDNRHSETELKTVTEDKQNARNSSHLKDLQTDIGKRIFIQTSILIPLLIMINVLLISYASDLKLGEAMISMVSTLIGIALNNAYRERQSMIEFLFGASASNSGSARK